MRQAELEAIIEQETRLAFNEGVGDLQPERLVRRAKSVDHPLHERLWGKSDAKAAMAWRIEQAREIIRTVRIRVVSKTDPNRVVTVPGYVRNPATPSKRTGYVGITVVQRSTATSYAVLEQELRALRGHYTRCMAIAEGLGLVDEARDAFESWDALMGKLMAKGVKVPTDDKRKRPDAGMEARP